MLKRYPVSAYDGSVYVTDEPDLARELMKNGPVIGYAGEAPDMLDDWSGILYLVLDMEAITPHYLELVWCRCHGLPLVIARTDGWIIREMREEDAPALCRFYREADAALLDGFPAQIVEERGRGELAERLRIAAYIRHVYSVRGFGMYVLEGNGGLIGMAGFEMEEMAGASRVAMGYYIDPPNRGRGIAVRACRLLLEYVRREYEIREVYAKIQKENPASMAVAQKAGFAPWMPDPVSSSHLLFRIPPA